MNMFHESYRLLLHKKNHIKTFESMAATIIFLIYIIDHVLIIIKSDLYFTANI